MSGWTRALQSGAAAALPSSDGGDLLFLGQPVDSALASRFDGWLVALSKEESDLEAQQAMLDAIREGIDADRGAPLTLASFAFALHRSQSCTLLDTQYRSLLDNLSWDLLDLLLPALMAEWRRAALATTAGLSNPAQLLPASSRPVSSASISVLLHLLDQLAQFAAPREVALALLAFFEQNVRVDDDEEEEVEVIQSESGEQKQVDRFATPAKPRRPDAIAPFQSISLAFPLLDLLSVILKRLAATPPAAPKSASSAAAAPSPVPAALSQRQIDLYDQLLSVFSQSLLAVVAQATPLEELATADNPNTEERTIWATVYERLANKLIEMLRPVLRPDIAATAAKSPSGIRPSVIGFLLSALTRFSFVYSTSRCMEIQAVLEGNRAFHGIAATRATELAKIQSAAQSSGIEVDAQASSLTPALKPVLGVLSILVGAIDACGLTPGELLSHYKSKRQLEREIEVEEEKRWDANGGEEPEDTEGEEEDDDGNAHDDEYNSSDEAENRAVADYEKRTAASKPPSALKLLKTQLHALPTYSLQGLGEYISTVLTVQYFWRIKPARRDADDAKSASSAVPAAAASDPQTEALFSEPFGAAFLAACQALSPRELLDSLAPYLCAVLLGAIRTARVDGIYRGLGGLTALWAILPPSSVQLTDAELETSGAWSLSESLLQCCFLCPAPWASLRTSLLHCWRSLLITLTPATRHSLLQLSLSSCGVPSVQAVILGRLKEEITAAYESPVGSSESAILSLDLLASLHSLLTNAEVDLAGSIDFLLALMNLFTFLVLREAKLSSAAGASKDGRLGLNLAAVRIVWREKWESVRQATLTATTELESELQQMKSEGRPQGEVMQVAQRRNQMQMAGDICARLLEHLQ